MASNIEVAPGGPNFCLLSERYEDSPCQGSCALKNEVKKMVIGYAIFEVGHSKKEERRRRRWRNRQFSRFLVMTSAVYSSYFRGIFGYRNAPKPRLGVYKGLKYLRLGVSKDFVCYGHVSAIPT